MSDDESKSDDEKLAELAHFVFDLARAGEDERLAAYLDGGVPVNLTDPVGNTLVMLAAYNGQPSTVKLLADRGADVNAGNDRGQTPIAGAVFKGETEVVRTLLAGRRRSARRDAERDRHRPDVPADGPARRTGR